MEIFINDNLSQSYLHQFADRDLNVSPMGLQVGNEEVVTDSPVTQSLQEPETQRQICWMDFSHRDKNGRWDKKIVPVYENGSIVNIQGLSDTPDLWCSCRWDRAVPLLTIRVEDCSQINPLKKQFLVVTHEMFNGHHFERGYDEYEYEWQAEPMRVAFEVNGKRVATPPDHADGWIGNRYQTDEIDISGYLNQGSENEIRFFQVAGESAMNWFVKNFGIIER